MGSRPLPLKAAPVDSLSLEYVGRAFARLSVPPFSLEHVEEALFDVPTSIGWALMLS